MVTFTWDPRDTFGIAPFPSIHQTSNRTCKLTRVLDKRCCHQHIFRMVCLHKRAKQSSSIHFESIIFFLLSFIEASLVSESKSGSGTANSADAPTILFTISKTSLIFGRDFGCRTRHRLATTDSLCMDLRE